MGCPGYAKQADKTGASLNGLNRFHKLGQNVKQIRHQTIVGNLEDRRFF